MEGLILGAICFYAHSTCIWVAWKELICKLIIIQLIFSKISKFSSFTIIYMYKYTVSVCEKETILDCFSLCHHYIIIMIPTTVL